MASKEAADGKWQRPVDPSLIVPPSPSPPARPPSRPQALREVLSASLHQLWALLWGPAPVTARKAA